jgi:hypothetical protein
VPFFKCQDYALAKERERKGGKVKINKQQERKIIYELLISFF